MHNWLGANRNQSYIVDYSGVSEQNARLCNERIVMMQVVSELLRGNLAQGKERN